MSETATYDPDRELVGQGLASITAGVFGGMPATGAIARTAVNVRSGAQSRVSAIVHSLLLLVVVSFAAGPIAHIPLAALAAVLMVTSCRMIAPRTVGMLLRSTRSDALTFVATAAVTICFDLIEAVEIGLVIAAFFALRSVARHTGVTREPLPGPPQPGDHRIALLRVHGAMFFGAAERIYAAIADDDHREISVVVLALSRLSILDATGAHTLGQLVAELERRGMTVIIKGVQPEHITVLDNVGALGILRHPAHLVNSLDDAVAHARSHISR